MHYRKGTRIVVKEGLYKSRHGVVTNVLHKDRLLYEVLLDGKIYKFTVRGSYLRREKQGGK